MSYFRYMEKKTLKYEKIWKKTLSNDEHVEYEFTVGSGYIKANLIFWGITSLALLFVVGLGIFTFLFALFYYKFYVKRANAYAFTNKKVLVHRGWLSSHLISVDYSKITDVLVKESFWDKLITHTGLLALNTAGTSMHEVVLKHIDSPYEVKRKLDSLRG